MEQTENKDTLEEMKDEEVEQVSGGADESSKSEEVQKRPVITAYGVESPKMIKPHFSVEPTVLGKYGMAPPKIIPEPEKKEKETEK